MPLGALKADSVLNPWTLAADLDLAYPEDKRSADLEERAQYFAALDFLKTDDVEVQPARIAALTEGCSIRSTERL